MRPRALPSLALLFVVLSAVSPFAQQLRKIGEMELALVGLSATVDGARPAIPKNVASGVKILIKGGGATLPPGQVARLLGAFSVEAELSGPSFGETVTVRQAVTSTMTAADLVLPLPAMAISGEHTLSNLRIVSDPEDEEAPRKNLLDLQPHTVPVDVIEQVLITSVRTRPLTLQEIKDKGIVLDSDDYLGFEFTLGVLLESKPVNVAFPVVFDREGIAVPVPQSLPPIRVDSVQEPIFPPKIIPMMLKIPKLGPGVGIDFDEADIRIPSLLVIPGEVGYLKQFFSAQLFVGNGTPATANLTVRDVHATIALPDDPDPNGIDPLSLAETVNGVQPTTMTVAAVGPDGLPATADDVTSLKAGEQGQAEFLIRGDEEGFHNIAFDIEAMLDGLPTGPLEVTGRATGGVLVRNPFFDVTFTLPSVVRANEPFKLYATVTNKGEGLANDVSMTLDSAAMSGLRLLGEGSKSIETLKPGEAETLVFDFEALRTGQAVATYLRFEGPGATGSLKFKIGLGERGVPLSPDTLVLPAQVEELPEDVVTSAMRVLGQAWSIANTPPNAMPVGVTRISKNVVMAKALALAEAGLRIHLGQPEADAIRDLLPDFYGPAPIDRGFDQLLRTTDAGRNFNRAVGAALAPTASANPAAFEAAFADVAASGRDFVSFSIANGAGGADADVRLIDAANRALVFTGGDTDPRPAVTSAAIAPLGPPQSSPLFGVIAAPSAWPYTLELTGRNAGVVDLSITYPRGDGQFTRVSVSGGLLAAGAKGKVVIDPARASPALEVDDNADGTIDQTLALSAEPVFATGPRFISASLIGPEVLQSAGPFGFNVAMLFDRVVDEAAAADLTRYTIPDNRFTSATRQLSGRLVFGSLSQPEGPYIPSSVTVANMPDLRSAIVGVETKELRSLLTDPGAVVSGRVIDGNGRLAAGIRVIYSANADWKECQSPYGPTNFAATTTDASGRYEFRYVARDRCNGGWGMRAIDEINQSQRSVNGNVRSAGERITADIALIGRGAVTGIVRDFSGAPVPEAQVVAISTLEPQVGGGAVTDGDGRYTIYNITVGPVSVKAAKGPSVGAAAGFIPRAGSAGTVDVTLNSGSVSVSGVVKSVENGVATPTPGAIVVFDGANPLGPGFIVAGAMTTGPDGKYAFTNMPAGSHIIRAKLPSFDAGQLTGVAAAGEVLTGRDILIEVQRNATVSGVVYYADGTVVPNPVVTLSSRGVVGEANGSYTIENALVSPNSQTIQAYSPDGLRQGSTSVLINQAGQTLTNADVTLNGIGTLDLVVIDSLGQPVRNQIVQIARTGPHISPTDCTAFYLAPTDEFGKVQFAGLDVGAVRVVSIRATGTGVDIARLDTTIPHEGAIVPGVLRFGGGGSVRGTVKDDQGQPVFGANIEVQSKIYNSGLCQMVSGISHRIRTDLSGQFRVTGVPVGAVSVTASQELYPTPVGGSGVLVRDGDELAFDLTLIHTTAGEVTGKVLLPDGQTRAGAGVAVSAKGPIPEVLVSTNADGEFRFPKIFPAGTYTFTVSDPLTGGVVRESLVLSAGESLVHDFRMKGRGTVRVKVVDGAGDAVSNALVTLTESEYPNELFEGVVEASNEGVVTFVNVHEGDFSVSASDENGRGGRVSGELPAAGSTVDVTVGLTVTGTVSGRFLMPDGVTAIPFGAVKLYANNRIIGNSTTESGEGNIGAFSFTYVPAGTVKVEALDPATGRSGVAIGQITTDGQLLTLDVHAQGLGTVTGRITHNGADQEGANVTVKSGTFQATINAGAGGIYSVSGVPEGLITVSADREGALPGSATGTLIGEGSSVEINVALQATGSITGVVTRADGVTPAPPSIVTVPLGIGRLTATTDDLGAYRFDLVPAGTRTVTVDVIGGIDTARATTNVVGGQTATVPLQLNGTGSISGRAQDANGAPVDGTVTLTGTGAFPYSTTLSVNPDGSFYAAQVLAGPFTAQVRHTTGPITLYGTATDAVAPGGTANIVVSLQFTGDITGVVRRSDNATPAVGAVITLKRGNGSIVTTTQAFSDGSFAFRGLPLDTYSIGVFDVISNGYARALDLVLDQNGDEAAAGVLVLDDTALTVTPPITPLDGAIGVSRTEPIVIEFSDQLSGTGGVNVKKGAASVVATRTLSANGRTMTLTGTWPDSSEITIEVTTGVTDIFGRHLAAPVTSRFFTVDTTAPSVVTIAPVDEAYNQSGTPAIVATFSESLANASVDGLIVVTGPGGVVAGTAAHTAANVVTFTPASPLVDNTIYTVTIDGAVDASGNEQGNAFTSRFSSTDTVAPVLVVSTPSVGGWTADTTPFISLTRNDVTSGIELTSGTLLIDGVAVAPSKTSGALSYQVPAASPLPDGTHTIDATSADRAGNVGTVQGTFMVDATDPSVAAITNITDGQTVAGHTTITATASDAGSGVTRIDIYRDGQLILTLQPPFSDSANFNIASDGEHFLTARAFDGAGNAGALSAPIRVIVNNDPLTLTITQPVENFRTRKAIDAIATTNEPVDRVEFTLGGITETDSGHLSPHTATLPVDALSDGEKTLTVTAYGLLGEVVTATRKIFIDRSSAVARWPFDEGTGLTANDASGNLHHGTLQNGAAWYAFGQFGKAIQFDGVDDGVSVADAELLNPETALTMAGWIAPAVLGAPQSIIFKNGAYSLALAADGRVEAVIQPNGVGTAVTSVAPVAPDLWTHVAATYDGGALRLYVNGVQVSTVNASGPLAVTGSGVWLGRAEVADSFNGKLDEIRIYDRALTAAEVQVLATSEIAGSRVTMQFRGGYVAVPGGSVYAFGQHNQGSLGLGNTVSGDVPTAMPVLNDVVSIVAENTHGHALTRTGTVYSWGSNFQGEIGDGTLTFRFSPVPLGLDSVVSIATGGNHSAAVRANGEAYAWGENSTGQLGDGTTTRSLVPKLVMTGVRAVAAGSSFTLFVKYDGTVWGTGTNTSGQLGDGSFVNKLTPVQMLGITTAVDATAGGSFSIIRLANGTLRAVGQSGRLGDGSNVTKSTPVTVTGLTDVVRLAAASTHVLALKADGTVWGWGSNSNGSIGDGTTTARLSPVPVSSLANIADIGAGSNQSIAVSESGVVFTWGESGFRELGDGANRDRWAPKPITIENYVWKVSAPTFNEGTGTYNTNRNVVISNVTAGVTMHYTRNGAEPTEADPIVAHNSSLLVDVSQTLTVKAFKAGLPPSNAEAQVYTMKVGFISVSPNTSLNQNQPQTVTLSTFTPGATLYYTVTPGSTYPAGDPTEASTLYTGPFVIGTESRLEARGFKPGWSPSDVALAPFNFNYGQLAPPVISPAGALFTGAGTVTLSSSTPGAQIYYTTNNTSVGTSDIPYTGPFLLSVSANPLRVKAFHNDYTASPESSAVFTVKASPPEMSLEPGSYPAGTRVFVTGDQYATQVRYTIDGVDPTSTSPLVPAAGITLGNFTLKARAFQTGASQSDVAAAVYSLDGDLAAASLSAGHSHGFATTPDGRLFGWGFNFRGQIGDGEGGGLSGPPLPWLQSDLTGVIGAAAGTDHSLFLTADHQVWATGWNQNGALGDGTNSQRLRPVLVPTLSNVVAIAAGNLHSAALLANGDAYTWGNNASGQLGDGTNTAANVPYLAMSGVVAIDAGLNHTLFVKADGTVWATGQNTSGQLGDGSTTNRWTPVQMSGVTGAVAARAGSSFSLVLLADGTLKAVGQGGRLGDGTSTPRTTAVPVVGLSGVVAFDAGHDHSLAVKSDGTVWAWGVNSDGELGVGTTGGSFLTAVQTTGIANVGTISAGNGFSLAATTDGVVYAWGTNTRFQVADGTARRRPSPTPISVADFTWKVGTPTFSQNTGTYNNSPTVIIASATPGSTIHYTYNGSEPTEADPGVASGSSFLVDVSQTLTAKAFKAGMPSSNPDFSIYTLQVAQPSISPSSGVFNTTQMVSITSSTPGTTLRYTIDGSDPTETSPIYTAPFAVSTRTTVTARGFKAGWTTSIQRQVTVNFNYGTLAMPVPSPAPGTYVGSVVVSLSALPGATIHYTTNGTVSGTGTPAYGGAFTFVTTTTLRAKAVHPDYTTSPELNVVYTLQASAPTIDLASGDYDPGTMFTVTADPATTVRISLDGADPTLSHPAIPLGVPRFAGSFTVKARAFRNNALDSAVVSRTYTLNSAIGAGQVMGGINHAAMATPDGRVFTWGWGGGGALGYGGTDMRSVPTVLPDVTGIRALAVGDGHNLALTLDDRIVAWGGNGWGQLGDGTTTQRNSPVATTALVDVVAVAAGGNHSLALTSNGQVYSWGSNHSGQLGIGNTSNASLPQLVNGLPTVVAIAAGDRHSVALTVDGEVYTWGANGSGQLGLSGFNNRLTPVLIPGLSNLVSITSSAFTTSALNVAGVSFAWGLDTGGLGTGTDTGGSKLPTPRAAAFAHVVEGWANFNTGGGMGVRWDGVLTAWGENSAGQAGDGSVTERISPVPVLNVSNATTFFRNSFSAAVTADGALWTWGYAALGGLGDNTFVNRPTPAQVATFAGLWAPAPPAFSAAPGTYANTFTLVVTTPMAGTTIRYTVDGTLPTETSPEALNGEIVINQSMTVRARVFAPGRLPSAVTAGAYVITP